MSNIEQTLATELECRPLQVNAAVKLLDEGATVPFISRYRKEVTGGLDDTQLRHLDERLRYLRELAERRDTILKSIDEQGKLTDALRQSIDTADNKTRLEDLYLPYKKKRRTRAQKAREAGLLPLAEGLFNDPTQDPTSLAAAYLNPEHKIESAKDALDGAKQILMERFAENAELLTRLRSWLWEHAELRASVVDGRQQDGKKFSDYFDFREALSKLPPHRTLALLRGRHEQVLQLAMVLPDTLEQADPHPCEGQVMISCDWKHQGRAADDWLAEVMRWTWKVKLATHLETELVGRLREVAEEDAITVFARNLKALLMASPAGGHVTLGLDPGLRTGVKVVAVDATGKLLEYATIFPHAPKNQWQQSLKTLADLATKHGVTLVAIGNGTASRETDRLAAELAQQVKGLTRVIVSEAGASVYSASELAAREFPKLDVTYRGAVSIARRLQDPLAELVKIEPKAIGVGQYQHDVSQLKLARGLDAVVEDCVNAVGVDVNTASAPLLAHISGLNATIAGNIVSFREKNGAFSNRTALKQVARLGDKTFEQAAGFLRISNGDNPLDASSVHPEAYPLVEKIANHYQRDCANIIADSGFLKQVDKQQFVDNRFGLPTIEDILEELEKPGRDPRGDFKTASFRDGVEEIKDLTIGMQLEGCVTNVTNFGAFVDVGVHQDGLVHISALADRFVKDPHEVVAPGDIVKVKVLEVDRERKRIGLTMRLNDQPPAANNNSREARPPARGARPKKNTSKPTNGTFADLFAKAGVERRK